MKLSLKIKYFLIFLLPTFTYNHLFLLPLKLQRTGISSRAHKEESVVKLVAERTTRKESHISLSRVEVSWSNPIPHHFAKVDLKFYILLPCYQTMTFPVEGRGRSCKMCCSSIFNHCIFI